MRMERDRNEKGESILKCFPFLKLYVETLLNVRFYDA